MTLIRLATAALLAAFLMPAHAQHVHKDGTAYGEDLGRFYSNWYQPRHRSEGGERRVSCCSLNDCEPAEIVSKNGKLYVRNHKMAPGRDVEIPEHLIESNQPDPRESPDGLNHVCMNYSGILCVTLGAGG